MASDVEKIISERLIRNIKDNQYDIEVDMVDIIKSYLDLPYFELYYDDNTYDYSGELRKTSDTNRDHIGDKVNSLLEMYTGDKMATYTSGYGWNYLDFDEDLGDYLGDIINVYNEKYIKDNIDFIIDNIDEVKTLEDAIDYLLVDSDYVFCEYSDFKYELLERFSNMTWNELDEVLYINKNIKLLDNI